MKANQTRKTKEADATPTIVKAYDIEDRKGRLKGMGGSQSDRFNNLVANQAIQALWLKNSTAEERDKKLSATVSALIGIAPKDELEGMLATQLVACHNASMECFRRAMLGEQTLEGRSENLAQANKCSRTFATLLEALNRHRGRGEQKITVEHLHVSAGGRAIVGNVSTPIPGVGANEKVKDQPHGLTYAPGVPVPRQVEAERVTVPSPGG